MAKRIEHLQESACYKCGCQEQCQEKVSRNIILEDIVNVAFSQKDYDYHNCGIWISLNAPEMVDES